MVRALKKLTCPAETKFTSLCTYKRRACCQLGRVLRKRFMLIRSLPHLLSGRCDMPRSLVLSSGNWMSFGAQAEEQLNSSACCESRKRAARCNDWCLGSGVGIGSSLCSSIRSWGFYISSPQYLCYSTTQNRNFQTRT